MLDNYLVNFCKENNVKLKTYAIFSDTHKLHTISIPSEKPPSPKVLIIGKSYKFEDSAIGYGILRFLNKVPRKHYAKVSLDIFPVHTLFNTRLERNILKNYIKKIGPFTTTISIVEDDICGFYIERNKQASLLTQKILDTLSIIFVEEDSPDRIIKEDISTESNIIIHLPAKQRIEDRVVAISRLIEDATNESIYNIQPILSIFRTRFKGL